MSISYKCLTLAPVQCFLCAIADHSDCLEAPNDLFLLNGLVIFMKKQTDVHCVAFTHKKMNAFFMQDDNVYI